MNLELKKLCRLGHVNKLKKLMNDNPKQLFPLYDITYWGCQSGNLDIVNLMISKAPDSSIWIYGLAGACRGGYIDIVNLMISKGADSWHWGFLNGCVGGDLNIIKLMISKGAYDCQGIYVAYKRNHWDVVHFLIKSGTDFSSCDKYYVEYLFNLPKLNRSVCYLLENLLHQGLVFNVQKYL
jgi:ankyrin repeat protein